MATRIQIAATLPALRDKAGRLQHIVDTYLAKIDQDEVLFQDPDGLVGVTITSAQKKAALFPVFDSLVADVKAIVGGW